MDTDVLHGTSGNEQNFNTSMQFMTNFKYLPLSTHSNACTGALELNPENGTFFKYTHIGALKGCKLCALHA